METDLTQKLVREAIQAARNSVSEPGKQDTPKVGAAILFPDGEIVAAYRGEMGEGEHAEYTLLEKKLKGRDLTGCILATTLEPCTKRGNPKIPCCDRVIASEIKKVFVGILDPNPDIYEHGCRKLRSAKVDVSFFEMAERNEVASITQDFIAKYSRSQALEGTVSFDYEKNQSQYVFGSGDFEFRTFWSPRGSTSIYFCAYKPGVVITPSSYTEISKIPQADQLDFSHSNISADIGDVVIGRNTKNHYIAIKILAVRPRKRASEVQSGEPLSALVQVQYKITKSPKGDFTESVKPYPLESNYTDEWIDKTLRHAMDEFVVPKLKRIFGLERSFQALDILHKPVEEWKPLPTESKIEIRAIPPVSHEFKTFKVTVKKEGQEEEIVSHERRPFKEQWIVDVKITYSGDVPSAILITRIIDATEAIHHAEKKNLPTVEIGQYL